MTTKQTQEHIILSLYLKAKQPISPSSIFKALGYIWPITSVRRAITNLADSNQLIKTKDTVTGMYGKQEHLWALSTDAN